MPSKTVVFIHGLFMSFNSWDHWVEYFAAKGYTATAIPYPGRDKPVAELRAEHPNPAVGKQTFKKVLQHHIDTVKGLNEPPIIIGHSLGGLLAQLLNNRGLGVASVAIDSAPPMGVISTKWSFVKSNWPLLNPLNSAGKPFLMPFSGFQYVFVNGMPEAEQRKAYDEQVVPESLRIGRGTLTPNSRINFKKERPPLLMIAAENDNIIPASLVRANFRRYSGSPSVTELKEFAGRNHYLVGALGWKEIADYILEWIAKHDL